MRPAALRSGPYGGCLQAGHPPARLPRCLDCWRTGKRVTGGGGPSAPQWVAGKAAAPLWISRAHNGPDPDAPDAGAASAAAAKANADLDRSEPEQADREAELDARPSALRQTAGETDGARGGAAKERGSQEAGRGAGDFISGVLSSVEETEEEQKQQSSVYRALRMTVIALKASPWLAVWLILGITGAILFVDVEGGGGGGVRQGVMSPLLLAGSVLGITTAKAKAGSASIGALGSAWGATWRASGFAGVISFYLRGVFAGKRIRVLQYPDSHGAPLSRRKRRMRTITVRSDSALVLRERIARSNQLFAKDVRLYLWVTPGLFEYIPDDGDLTMVAEQGFVVWARPGVAVPVQGPILPAETSTPGQQVAAGELSGLLSDLAGLRLERQDEQALVRLAMQGEETLTAAHRAFGTGGTAPDATRFRTCVLQVLELREQRLSDSK